MSESMNENEKIAREVGATVATRISGMKSYGEQVVVDLLRLEGNL